MRKKRRNRSRKNHQDLFLLKCVICYNTSVNTHVYCLQASSQDTFWDINSFDELNITTGNFNPIRVAISEKDASIKITFIPASVKKQKIHATSWPRQQNSRIFRLKFFLSAGVGFPQLSLSLLPNPGTSSYVPSFNKYLAQNFVPIHNIHIVRFLGQ